MKLYEKHPVYCLLVAGIIAAAGIFFLCKFPVGSEKTIWNGYHILAVPLEIPEQDVLTLLEKGGIRRYVTESNSIPVLKKNHVDLQNILSDFVSHQLSWFQNTEEGMRYLFLNDIPQLESRIKNSFRSSQWKYIIEDSSTVNSVPFLMVSLLFAAGLIYSVYKRSGSASIFFVSGVSFVLFAFSCSRFSGFFSALCAVLSTIFFAELLHSGKTELKHIHLMHRLKQARTAPVLALISVLSASLGGLHGFLLFLTAVLISLSLLLARKCSALILKNVAQKRRLHELFTPVAISDTRILCAAPYSPFPRKRLVLLSFAGLLLIAGTVLTQTNHALDSGVSGFGELSIPAPSGYTAVSGFSSDAYTVFMKNTDSSALPDLGDFLIFSWNVQTFPWKRLQAASETPGSGTKVVYSEYAIDEAGHISSTEKTVAEFDSVFIRNALSPGETTPLERMLIRQNRFLKADILRLQK